MRFEERRNMKIVIYGLGIIGASPAASLNDAGHFVPGKKRNRAPVEDDL